MTIMATSCAVNTFECQNPLIQGVLIQTMAISSARRPRCSLTAGEAGGRLNAWIHWDYQDHQHTMDNLGHLGAHGYPEWGRPTCRPGEIRPQSAGLGVADTARRRRAAVSTITVASRRNERGRRLSKKRGTAAVPVRTCVVVGDRDSLDNRKHRLRNGPSYRSPADEGKRQRSASRLFPRPEIART